MQREVLKSERKMVEDLKKIVEVKKGCKVLHIKILSKATMNHVFKIETDKETIVARIFMKKDFPDWQVPRFLEGLSHGIKLIIVDFCRHGSSV